MPATPSAFSVTAELNLEMPPRMELGKLAERWFDEGSMRLAGSFRQQVEAVLQPPTAKPLTNAPMGPPGTPLGILQSSNPIPFGTKYTQRAFSRANLSWLINRITKFDPPPSHNSLYFFTESETRSIETQPLLMRVDRWDSSTITSRDGPEGRWLQLAFQAPESCLADMHGQQRWLDFLRGVAEDVNPSFGLIDYSYWDGQDTAVELTVGPPWRNAYLSMPESRQVLRGYGWLTVLAQELAERLGGVSFLRASGAFHEVAQLRNGGVWLLATQDYWEFDEAALRRVFHMVRSLLPPGSPDRRAQWGPQFRVVYEDATRVGGHTTDEDENSSIKRNPD